MAPRWSGRADRSRRFPQELSENGLTGSMNRVDPSAEDAATECFGWLFRQRFSTTAQLGRVASDFTSSSMPGSSTPPTTVVASDR